MVAAPPSTSMAKNEPAEISPEFARRGIGVVHVDFGLAALRRPPMIPTPNTPKARVQQGGHPGRLCERHRVRSFSSRTPSTPASSITICFSGRRVAACSSLEVSWARAPSCCRSSSPRARTSGIRPQTPGSIAPPICQCCSTVADYGGGAVFAECRDAGDIAKYSGGYWHPRFRRRCHKRSRRRR
jgi:hypothetical protein